MSTTVTQSKVDATTKKTKAPAATAGVENLGPAFDPFAPVNDLNDTPSIEKAVGSKNDKIHIRLQQRNGRKTLTTVQGIPSKYNHSKILKAMKKEFACNGTVVKPEVDSGEEESPAPVAKNHGDVLQLQGDQRVAAKQFLIDSGIVAQKEAKDLIVV
ncbi:translation initiation factor SUI1 [Cryptococcus deuterogattii 99/473]|uniref:Translation initiation factor SUI1 n=2 Tax=Cryptococcus deuterogattii TaxID=1859096 RepID=A0A0D0V2J3_9TREE|nr:translation initiation factor SUI1 [Cryptococcus deuterogattii LA55]KIR32936.1 translation initiation factor SUI1 [Cryptococcus deuterogattii MMRL2647]KIR39135.1 translation initiation factor SUI1 [Cryptococcus deuterogattii Ram5]KIR71263.1 translation initiation factor SUI1 [Cryptococcus deuterogattii CA1014]KIR94557.1 translation initiation factor SUI1 [Cryptococcus deuterogattii CBS 10090]KIS00918.1 translation initiation factor SUI1 [Cryptococcus deuterogattii 2001/935-1]KIY57627.1 tra